MADAQDQTSSLLDSLPAVFQEDREGREPNFLGRFLLGFEKLLLGLRDPAEPGIEEIVAGLYRYFAPVGSSEGDQAPREFLPWLAGWLALVLREDWDEKRQRHLIANAVSLYRLRGTKRGVEAFVRIYTVLGAQVDEFGAPFQVGVHSTVGVDTIVGDGGAPFFFKVRVFLPVAQPAERRRQLEISRAIVDLQKPAHTYYTLDVETPKFQIAVHSTVGEDTLLTD